MGAYKYFPHTDADVRAMLDRIGVASLDDLYADVPEKYRLRESPDLPGSMSEEEIRDFFQGLDSRNARLKVFAGAGAYDHYTPSVVPYIASRSEFLTAYTPYQAEISQGTLRYIFEYQTMICNLTGLDASNASLYDGPTAAAEAMKMALACTRKKSRVLLSRTLLPNVVAVVETYARFHGVELGYVPEEGGQKRPDRPRRSLRRSDGGLLRAHIDSPSEKQMGKLFCQG